MTLFEAIQRHVEIGGNQFTIKKHSEDKYTALFHIVDGNEFSQSGKDIINTVCSAVKKLRPYNNDVTATDHEQLVLVGIAELMNDYSPFLHFSIFNPEHNPLEEDSTCHFEFISDFGDKYGSIARISYNLSDLSFEEMIRISTNQTALELAIHDTKTCLAVIANYIRYEYNKSHGDNHVEVIIKRENQKYSASFRVNSITNRADTTQPAEATAERLGDAVKAAIKNNKILAEYFGEYYLNIASAEEMHSYDLIKVDMILNKLKNKNIILSIRENFDPNDKDAWRNWHNGFYKVEFKDISNNKVLAKSCSDNLKRAVLAASEKLIDLYHLSSKLPR
jgi:hypothetical protein